MLAGSTPLTNLNRAAGRQATGAALEQLLDTMTDGVALFDLGGRLAHENPPLTRLLAAEQEACQLMAAITRAAATMGALADRRLRTSPTDSVAMKSTSRKLRTGRGWYRLSATYLGSELLGWQAGVAVVVSRIPTVELTPELLRVRYHLTDRELDVTALLVRGHPNAEVARTLGISPATARHHTASVLRKLAVRSRAAIAARLWAETDARSAATSAFGRQLEAVFLLLYAGQEWLRFLLESGVPQ